MNCLYHTKKEMKEEILKLHHGQCYTVPESDYGKAEIWKIWENYFVFEMSMYGMSTPSFAKTYRTGQEEEIVELINSWT